MAASGDYVYHLSWPVLTNTPEPLLVLGPWRVVTEISPNTVAAGDICRGVILAIHTVDLGTETDTLRQKRSSLYNRFWSSFAQRPFTQCPWVLLVAPGESVPPNAVLQFIALLPVVLKLHHFGVDISRFDFCTSYTAASQFIQKFKPNQSPAAYTHIH